VQYLTHAVGFLIRVAATGAVIGGVTGNVVGGGLLGSAAGGVIGHEVTKKKQGIAAAKAATRAPCRVTLSL